jgi:SAM-dependent methyltransferase
MSATDTAYGISKRLAFCAEVLAQTAPKLVIDVGCGTGTALTRPLAESAPATQFIGVDSDEPSLDYARRNSPPPNLAYRGVDELRRYTGADLIIASEVLEHVEDPERFLAELRSLLGSSGRMLVTVPNGWGPFEVATLLENVLRLSGLLGFLRRARRWVAEARPVDRFGEDTLAVSPHINFFSWRQLRRIFARSGLAVRVYRPRTFLCGFLFDPLLRALGLLEWNARVAERLPPQLVSDWMFVLEPVAPAEAPLYRRCHFDRWRRRLNERRWGLA